MTHNINNSDFQLLLSPFIGNIMKELLPLKKKKKVYVHSYVVQDLITVRDINSK